MATSIQFSHSIVTVETAQYADFGFADSDSARTDYVTGQTDNSAKFRFPALTTGSPLSFAPYTTIQEVFLFNEDLAANGGAGNFVTLTFKTGGGGATLQTMKVLAGQKVLLVDIAQTTNMTVTANTATVLVRGYILGQ